NLRELTLEEVAAQRNLRRGRRSIAIARGRLPRKAARQRRQVHVRAEIPRWKASAVQPDRQKGTSRTREVVPLAGGHRTWCLTDQHDTRLVEQRWPDGVGELQIPCQLARAARQHVVDEPCERARLTLVRTHTYAQRG